MSKLLSELEQSAQDNSNQNRKRQLKNLKFENQIEFNSQAESRFLKFTHELIRDSCGEVSKIEIYREAAFDLDISTETVKRYLLKHTARSATLEETDSGKIRSKIFREVKFTKLDT